VHTAEAALVRAGADTNTLFFSYEIPKAQEAAPSIHREPAPEAHIPDVLDVPGADSEHASGSDGEGLPQHHAPSDGDPSTEEASALHIGEESELVPHAVGANDDVNDIAQEQQTADSNVERPSVTVPAARDDRVSRVSEASAPCTVPVEPRLVLRSGVEGPGDTSSATAFIVKGHDGRVGEEDLTEHISMGVLSRGDTLRQLSNLLEQVFAPSIMDAAAKNSSDVSKTHVPPGQQLADDAELLAALQKFVGQLKTSEVHLTGSVQLAMPHVDAGALASKDDDLLATLESTMHEWTIVLQDVKLAEAEKSAQGEGPLDEIHFWRERNNVLGGLHEQINLSKSQAIIECADCTPAMTTSLLLAQLEPTTAHGRPESCLQLPRALFERQDTAC
jgi:dynein heavy chain, axonemal